MTIDPEVLRAKQMADAKKRRAPDMDRLRPKVSDFKVSDVSGVVYCGKCEYPLKDGDTEANCYTCATKRVEQRKQLEAWIEAIGGLRAWEDFTVAKQVITPMNEAAIKAARAFDARTGSCFLFGPKGAGKSHMAAIIKRPLVTGGHKVRTINMPLIIDEILSGIKSGTYGSLTKTWLDQLTAQPILSIEDMGVEKPSDHALGFYYKFINARYEAKRHGMIITCNYSMVELENRWAAADPQGRVVSRLKEMCRGNIISFAGCPDWRAR